MAVRFASKILLGAAAALALSACSTMGGKAAGAPLWKDEPDVRVKIMHTTPVVHGAAGKAWHIVTDAGRDMGAMGPGAEFELKAADQGVAVSWRDGADKTVRTIAAPWLTLRSESVDDEVLLGKVPFGVGWWWESSEDRGYSGDLEVRPQANGNLLVVCVLPLEDYLLGVVPSEIGGEAPPEAAKAQAVAARSEVVTALKSRVYAGDHYDICSDVDCQVFSGNRKRTAESDRAVWDTEGLVLMHGGGPVGAYYASNCGGCSESVENVWSDRSGPKEYWSGHFDAEKDPGVDLRDEAQLRAWVESEPDVWCAPTKPGVPNWAKKNFRWTREFTQEELDKAVAKKKDVGHVVAIKPVQRGVSGRLMKVEFVGDKDSVVVGPEIVIRRLFDPPLKSGAFVVDAPKAEGEKFVLTGAGYGHGVGMCQTGAMARATAGQTFDRILTSYYPGTEVRRSWGEK